MTPVILHGFGDPKAECQTYGIWRPLAPSGLHCLGRASGAPVLSTVSLCEGVSKGSPSMPMESRLHVRYVRLEVCVPKLPSTTESPCGQGPISLAQSRLVLPYHVIGLRLQKAPIPLTEQMLLVLGLWMR